MIGTNITDWSTVEGAYYAGAGGEGIWLALSILLLLLALVFGSLHEKKAYIRAR